MQTEADLKKTKIYRHLNGFLKCLLGILFYMFFPVSMIAWFWNGNWRPMIAIAALMLPLAILQSEIEELVETLIRKDAPNDQLPPCTPIG